MAALLFLGAGPVHGNDGAPDKRPAAALRAGYVALRDDPRHNPFQRPLYMKSSEDTFGVNGEIYALVDHPFATAGAQLGEPSPWCEILILHLNTKYCRPSSDGRGTVLKVSIGKKHDQPMNEAHRVNFDYRVIARTATYLQVRLDAAEGPLGTRDYLIVLEATPAEGGRTLIRLSYSYAYGMAGRLAMQAYLGTVGRNKVGFTVLGKGSDGEPLYIGGMRGVVERNTMRYYLAIEAFLGTLAVPAHARLERSLRDWFEASERHALQLHEIELGEYLLMKRKEHSRQQADIGPGQAGGGG